MYIFVPFGCDKPFPVRNTLEKFLKSTDYHKEDCKSTAQNVIIFFGMAIVVSQAKIAGHCHSKKEDEYQVCPYKNPVVYVVLYTMWLLV